MSEEYDLDLPLRRVRRERIAPMSQNVVTILLAKVAKQNARGEAVASMVQAMLLFGEEHVLTHTTEIRDQVIEDALASFHYTFHEAQGGPTHDHDDCPYRRRTP